MHQALSHDHAQRPDVSFLMPAHNVAPYIAEAINSALAQTDVSVEVIVVDDCSTDATPDVVASIAATNPNVILVRRATTGGPSVARNQATDLARGRWLAVLDGDDVIEPCRTRRLLDLAATWNAKIIADNYERMSESGRLLGTTMIPRATQASAFFVDMATFVSGNIILRKQDWTLGAIKHMVDADFLRSHGIRYREDPLLRNEDFLVCVALMRAGAGFLVTPEVYYKYRVRAGSLSWRLTVANCAAMVRASKDLALGADYRSDPVTARALEEYDRALQIGGEFSQIVEDAKSKRWTSAALAGLTTPRVWPLLARFGSEALGNKLRRMTPIVRAGASRASRA